MEYKIKSRIWVEVEDNVLLGKGRVSLLKKIQATGSLSKAAKSLNMSYKKAWKMIDSINKSAKHPVIETTIGGSKGGGSSITEHGQKLITTYEKITRKQWDLLNAETVHFNEL